MGSIATPTRVVRGGPLTGETIEVTTPDHVLDQPRVREWRPWPAAGELRDAGQLAPWLEVHFPMATVSFSGQSYEPDAPVSLYVDDDSPAATEDWQHEVDVPVDDTPVVEAGARHFIAVLRGDEEPVLTAEQARHVLEVTILAYASIADGAAHTTTTTFSSRP